MNNLVSFQITAGSIKGKTFEFTEHDTFIFGRAEECHCRLPNATQISRRHFIVEMNPPNACIKNFCSLNGDQI